MKILKVDHVRTGTTVTNRQGEGMIYVNPSKKADARKNLNEHIYKLNEKAKVLYSPISPVNAITSAMIDKSAKQDVNASAKAIKYLVNGILRKNESGIPSSNVLLSQILEKAKEAYTSSADPDKLSGKIVERCLRKKLCKKSEIAKALFAAILSANKAERINLLDKDEVKAFFDLAYEDYYKKEQLKKIEESIIKKDVKVQVKEGTDGEKHLVLSSAENPKKHFYFDFIKEYASKDTAGREEMLIHFRQLIILYYSGTEAYHLSIGSDVGAWTFGSSLPDVADNFNDEAATLINECQLQQAEKDKCTKKRNTLANNQKNYRFGSPEFKNLDNQKKDCETAIASCNSAIKEAKKKIKELLSDTICNNYRSAIKTEGLSDSDIFWIGFIQGTAEKLFEKTRSYTSYKISTKYLYEVTFNEWLSFIALKVIDMGKAVYHFAMPDCSDIRSGKEIKAGKIQPLFEEGITSFDYERIKAKETITREFAVHATYASGIFSNTVANAEYRLRTETDAKGHTLSFEDSLQYKEENWEQALVPDAKKKLLMFFGGQSKWNETDITAKSDLEMTLAFQEMIKVIRNSNYHYAGSIASPKEESIAVMRILFDKEFSELGRILREKYYSNNVPVYYAVSDIDKLMSFLYTGESKREAQIPSFGNILKKKEMPTFVQKNIAGSLLAKYNVQELEKFRSALYFVLKEIYYYGFLKETNIKERFLTFLSKSKDSAKNPDAYDNFQRRIKDLNESCSFGEICQMLMTDYNQQNQGNYKVKSQIQEEKDRKSDKGHKYEHFKMLLYVTIQGAFTDYLEEKKDVFAFLKTPDLKEHFFESNAASTFTSSWNADIFNETKQILSEDPYCLSWYALAHLLSPKQLNHLQGDIRSYIQFVGEINKREKSVFGKERDTRLVDTIGDYEKILKVLEFVMTFIGKTSNELTDYFADADDYAKHLYSYVGYATKKEEKNNATLSAFCEKQIVQKGVTLTDKIGIYHDGTNPIINNNVVKAMMYGNEAILSEAISKVSGDLIHGDVVSYFRLKKELEKVFEKGECTNQEEQAKLREFQSLKNKVELYDIAVFTDIINDYMGELVNMAYLRERDLMYYQLGYHYLRQEYATVEEKYKTISGKNINITSGALLYQITAMYSYDLPIIYKEEDNYKYSTDGKIVRFVKRYCQEDLEDYDNVYYSGLELFEQRSEHDNLHLFRNEIDHLKYFISAKKSILDMYSKVYNGFFSYDTKLKKSVSYIFTNILAKYFVIADTKIIARQIDGRRFAALSISEMSSDMFNYKGREKIKDKNGNEKIKDITYSLPVRSDDFLKDVRKLVEYSAK